MTSALIGYTGFVGSNLACQMHFDEFYNSANIEDIRGQSFDLVVCAGAPGTKWYANAHPEEDAASIVRLCAALYEARIERLITISTIDAIEPKDAYGRGRRVLELNTPRYVIRLPALFGPNLTKNAFYDLMYGQRLSEIAPNATYQWYPLRRLGKDLAKVRGVTNLFSEPISMGEIRDRFFPGRQIGPCRDDAPSYNVASDFRLSKAEIFTEMEAFLAGNA